jgi:hypothetical protein
MEINSQIISSLLEYPLLGHEIIHACMMILRPLHSALVTLGVTHSYPFNQVHGITDTVIAVLSNLLQTQ